MQNNEDSISEIEPNSNFSSVLAKPTEDNDSISFIVGVANHSEMDEVNNIQNHEMETEGSAEKTYEELISENEDLRKLLDSKDSHLNEIKRNHEVVLDENHLISLEIHDIQKTAKEHNRCLTADVEQITKVNEYLQRKVDKMKVGISELNEMLFEAILQLKGNGNHGISPTKAPDDSTISNAVAIVSQPLPLHVPSPIETEATISQCPTNFHNFELSSAMATQLASIDKLIQQNQVTPGSNKLQTLKSKEDVRFAPKRAPGRRPSIADQISRCLESISTARQPDQPKLKPIPEKMTKTSSKKSNKKVNHAVDSGRQEGFYCICGASLTTKLGLMTHINYHTYSRQFLCTVVDCGRRFFATSGLKNHMQVKHGMLYRFSGRQGCRKCGQTFVTRQELYRHYKIVHNKIRKRLPSQMSSSIGNGHRPLSTITSKNTILESGNEITKVPQAETSSKPTIFNTIKPPGRQQQDLSLFHRTHELDTSKPDGYIFCVCGRHFASPIYLRMHINYFSCEPKFRCEICDKVYNGVPHLRQHMQLKHKMNLVGTCGCSLCGLIFETKMAYNQHCKNIHNGLTKTTQRTRVDKPSSSTTDMVRNGTTKRQLKTPAKYIMESAMSSVRQSKHPKITKERTLPHPSVQQNGSGMKVTLETVVSSHSGLPERLKSRSGGSRPTIKCNFCPRMFVYEHNLKQHFKLVHLPQQVDNHSTSSTTGFSPPSNTNTPSLVQHGFAIADSENKVFKCLCGVYFVALRTLKDHIRLKLGMTKFTCEICKETFRRHDYLKSHLQLVHKMLKPEGMACRLCGLEGFTCIKEIKNHRAVYHNNNDANQDPVLTLPRN